MLPGSWVVQAAACRVRKAGDRQRGCRLPFCPPAGHPQGQGAGVPQGEGVPTRCLAGGTRGTPRAAGSAPSSCTRWTPARTPIPTSSPRRRPATSTKSSVSGPTRRPGLSADGVHSGDPPGCSALGPAPPPRASAPTLAAPCSSPCSSQREAGVPGCLQQPDVSPATPWGGGGCPVACFGARRVGGLVRSSLRPLVGLYHCSLTQFPLL